MGLLTNIQLGWATILDRSEPIVQEIKTLASDTKKEAIKRYLPYDSKAVSRTRLDIKNWNDALNASNAEEPKNFQLQKILNDVMLDAFLSSQIHNRNQLVNTMEFSLKTPKGEKDEEQTNLLKSMTCYRNFNDEIQKSNEFGYSLVELSLFKDLNGVTQVKVDSIPRTNVVPQLGRFYKDYSEDKFIEYRKMNEFGTWILEFDSKTKGLLNKAVTHVLMKRFAQSCWSELCEIYGIPPRTLHTDTQNPALVNRAKKMMADTGAASWWIVDNTEKLEFSQGTVTNGDVFKNLINLCSNEISLLISGAVIGQDTKNGSNSKEQTSQKMLMALVQSDMRLIEEYWNTTILPALAKLGVVKPGLVFEFDPVEDLGELWTRVKDSMNSYNFDIEWMNQKFGLQITEEKKQKDNSNLSIGPDFFV